MSWIGHAEELRREGGFVRRVCEGARDAVHVRSRLEAKAGAGCRRRRRRLEIWIVAPLGVGSEEPRHFAAALRFGRIQMLRFKLLTKHLNFEIEGD